MAKAQRRRLSPEDVRALLRQAIGKIRESPGSEDEAAREVLKQLGDPRLITQFIEVSFGAPPSVARAVIKAGMDHEDINVERTAAEILVAAADKIDATDLVRHALQDPDEEVRRRGAEALESMSTDEALELFVIGIRDSAESVKRNVAESFELVVGSLQHPLRLRLVQRLNENEDFRTAFVENPDPLVRRQVARALGFSRSRAAIPSLRQLLRDEDFEVRQETVLALFALDEPETAQLLREALHDNNYLVCSTVLDVLASMYSSSSEEYLEYLREAVRHPLADVRRHAIACLDRYPYSRVSDILKDAADDPDLEVSRRAGDIIGRHETGAESVNWLDDAMDNYSADEKLLALWEAGNIGQESNIEDKVQFGEEEGEEQGRLAGVRAILEEVLAEGSRPARLHAVGELTSLTDVADSRGLRKALYDEDASIRTMVADAFTRTRDAAFLVEAMGHPDVYVRRRAVAGLIRNPGGPKAKPGETGAQEKVEFAKARSAGVEFCSVFVDALKDSDDEVRRLACDGLQEIGTRLGFLPVQMLERIEQVSDNDDSYLVAEAANETLDAVKEADITPLLVKAGDSAVGWRGELAKLAHQITYDTDAEQFKFPGMEQEETRKFLLQAEEYRLRRKQMPPIAALLTGSAPAKAEQALPLLRGFAYGFGLVADSVRFNAYALSALSKFDQQRQLQQWQRSISTELKLPWGESAEVQELQRLVSTKNLYASAICLGFLAAAGDGKANQQLGGMLQSDDALEAACAALGLQMKDQQLPDDRRRALEAFCDGRSAAEAPDVHLDALLALVRHGQPQRAADICALTGRDAVEFRTYALQSLLYVTRLEGIEDVVRGFAGDESQEPLARLGAMTALLGCGREIDPALVARVGADSQDEEIRIAHATAQTMMEQREPAEYLKEQLRGGETHPQLATAYYLGLARVRSAIAIFASISDKNVPFGVRSACAAMLIKNGHGDGLQWLRKFVGNVRGIAAAKIAANIGRAINETLPLMNRCDYVNLGRFL